MTNVFNLDGSPYVQQTPDNPEFVPDNDVKEILLHALSNAPEIKFIIITVRDKDDNELFWHNEMLPDTMLALGLSTFNYVQNDHFNTTMEYLVDMIEDDDEADN